MNGITLVFILKREAPKGSLLKRETERERVNYKRSSLIKQDVSSFGLVTKTSNDLVWHGQPCQTIWLPFC